LERQNKEVKAKLVEMETAQRTKTKATTATLESKNNRLDNILNGRTLLTAVPSTKATGPNGTP
jgi:hypothetical protein